MHTSLSPIRSIGPSHHTSTSLLEKGLCQVNRRKVFLQEGGSKTESSDDTSKLGLRKSSGTSEGHDAGGLGHGGAGSGVRPSSRGGLVLGAVGRDDEHLGGCGAPVLGGRVGLDLG